MLSLGRLLCRLRGDEVQSEQTRLDVLYVYFKHRDRLL